MNLGLPNTVSEILHGNIEGYDHQNDISRPVTTNVLLHENYFDGSWDPRATRQDMMNATGNLLMQFTSDYSDEDSNTLSRVCNMYPGAFSANIIDLHTFRSMLEETDDLLGVTRYDYGMVENREEGNAHKRTKLGPLATVLFYKMFDERTRRDYISTGMNYPLTSPLQRFIQNFRPLGIMESRPSDKLPRVYESRTVTHGYCGKEVPLMLPLDRVYNVQYLKNQHSYSPVGKALPLYYCIGPGDEILHGGIGDKSIYEGSEPAEYQSVMFPRMVSRVGNFDKTAGRLTYAKDPLRVYDQKLTDCFYIGSEGEEEGSVLKFLEGVCKTNSQTAKVIEANMKEIACIRIGAIYGQRQAPTISGNIDSSESLVIDSFEFALGKKWRVRDFFEKVTDYDSGTFGRLKESREPRKDYDGPTRQLTYRVNLHEAASDDEDMDAATTSTMVVQVTPPTVEETREANRDGYRIGETYAPATYNLPTQSEAAAMAAPPQQEAVDLVPKTKKARKPTQYTRIRTGEAKQKKPDVE